MSRVSLRQATVSLEVQGLLEVRHGGGIYVRSLNVDPERLKTMLTRRRRLPDVLEAREAIECMLARLAAQRRTDADLAAIDAALRAMAVDIANGGIGEAADQRFHTAVAHASKNKLLRDVMKALADPIQETRLESLGEPGRPVRSLADHRRIAEAIRREDPRAAETAMRRHLKIVSDIRLMRWTPGELDESEGDSPNGPATPTASCVAPDRWNSANPCMCDSGVRGEAGRRCAGPPVRLRVVRGTVGDTTLRRKRGASATGLYLTRWRRAAGWDSSR